jgi:hypothetical protein
MIHTEFIPKHLEKALDMARQIATFGHIEFAVCYLQLRITDPAKVVHYDLIFTPDVYKADKTIFFGVNLQMFYKLIKSLDADKIVEIHADESVMKINQGSKFHTIIHQDIQAAIPEIINFEGPQVTIPTKLFQKYIRAIGNIAPAFEIQYSPVSDTLSFESVNSMYRTLFTYNTGMTLNSEEEKYCKSFLVKFVEMAINPSLEDKVEITLGETLVVHYQKNNFSVVVTVSGYTDA